ncbi:MAG: transcriptional regulator [Armatimonadetes bacterium]|nr:transcriptional regulator [Armatimonadota bacterium]
MSQVLSMRLQPSQMERLRRVARRLGRSPGEAGALLVEEALRRTEFGHIEFRDSPAGRQAHVQGSSLAVWEVVWLARHHGMDAAATAEHLEWPEFRVKAALAYAVGFPEEIEAAIEDNAGYGWEAVQRMVPGAAPFPVRAGSDSPPAGGSGERQADDAADLA